MKTEIRQAIDHKCVYEAGGNSVMALATGNKTVSRNEIEQMKEIERSEAKKGKGEEEQRAINPETLFYTLKQLGEVLGMQNEKFMKVTPNPPLKPVVMRQKHEIGSKILREIIDEELNDLIQLSHGIKHIESFIKQKTKLLKYNKEIIE